MMMSCLTYIPDFFLKYKGDHTRTNPAKFGSYLSSGSGEED
jgi:hypothetical protein